mgnify:FL=1
MPKKTVENVRIVVSLEQKRMEKEMESYDTNARIVSNNFNQKRSPTSKIKDCGMNMFGRNKI